MSVHLIVLVEPHPQAWKQLDSEWPGRHHIISDRLALVAPPGISTASGIQESIGITRANSETPIGIVIQLERPFYSGVLPTPTTDWFKQAEEEDE